MIVKNVYDNMCDYTLVSNNNSADLLNFIKIMKKPQLMLMFMMNKNKSDSANSANVLNVFLTVGNT